MRIEIADAMGSPYIITTRNIDLLAAWIVETINTIKPTRDMPARVLVYPSFTFDPDNPMGYADWIGDTRILMDYGIIRTPADTVKYLAEQIERYEALKAKDAERI